MIKNLAVFGDSWPAGEELKDPSSTAFPVLLSHRLGLTLHDFSQPATSIEHALRKFLQSHRVWQHDTMVLFCLTNYARSMRIESHKEIEIYPKHRTEDSINYYKFIYSNELGMFNQLKAILLVQSLCALSGVPLVMITNWNDVTDHDLVDHSKIYPQSMVEILGIPNLESEQFRYIDAKNIYIHPNQNHPNVLGHQLIADKLYEWIQQHYD